MTCNLARFPNHNTADLKISVKFEKYFIRLTFLGYVYKLIYRAADTAGVWVVLLKHNDNNVGHI